MASTLTFPLLVSHKTPVPIVLAGPTVTLGPNWRDYVSNCISPLVKRLSEENYPHPLGQDVLVTYSQVHPALIDPVYHVFAHGEQGNIVTDRMITEYSPDTAALRGYLSVIKIIEELETRHPNEFSFFLWHVVAGKHGSWDPNWEIIRGELIRRHVNLSMILLDDCPFFEQLFSAISPASSRITPWFRTFPNHRFLLSGFMPPGELDGGVLSLPMVSAAHPSLASSISVPSTIEVTPWNPPSELPAHDARYADDQCAAPHLSQCAGLDVYVQPEDPALVPFQFYKGPQASSSLSSSSAPVTVQSQPHPNLNNMTVPETQGLVPLDWPAHPHNSGVEQRQPTPHSYTENIDSHNDIPNANARSIYMSSGLSDEMSANEWTWTLNFNDTRVHVRALMVAAVGDPKLSDLPKELRVEFAVPVDPNLSILDIQAWISEYNAAIVRLIHVDGADNSNFDELVQKIRAHGYAIVSWQDRDRLLLAALGESLLCAAFPENEIAKRPTSQPPQKLRRQQPRKKPSQKRQSSDKEEKQRCQQRHRPYPATTSKSSSDGPCDGQYPESAAQSPKNSEAMDVFEILKFVDFGGNGDKYDSVS